MIQDSSLLPCLPYLQVLPIETFLNVTVRDLKKKSAYESIQTFCQLQLVCKDLKDKVDNCWKEFLQLAGNAPLLLPSSQKLELENAYQFLKLRYPTLKKWANTTPTIDELDVIGMEQSFVNNHLGNPELLTMLRPRNKLARVDLMTQNTFYLNLEVNPFSYGSASHIVSSEQWLQSILSI